MSCCNDGKISSKSSKSSKKVAFALAMFAFVIACCFYFLYWIKTPQYSLYEAYDAVKTHDVEKFDRYVDLDSVLGYAYDDYVTVILGNDGSFGGQLAFGMATALKDHIVRMSKNKIHAEIEAGSYVKDDKSGVVAAGSSCEKNTGNADKKGNNSDMQNADKSGDSSVTGDAGGRSSTSNNCAFSDNPMLKVREGEAEKAAKWKYKGVENVKKEGKIAYATLKFHDDELSRDFNMIVRMREKNDGQWQVIAFDNLMELVKEIGQVKMAEHS